MPETNCTSCHQLLRFQDNLAGKTIRCPKCRTHLTLPGTVAAAPVPAPANGETSTEAVFETQESASLREPALVADPFHDNPSSGALVRDESEAAVRADADEEDVVVPRKKAGKSKKKKKNSVGMLVGLLVVVVVLGGGAGGYYWWMSQNSTGPILKNSAPIDDSYYNHEDPGAFQDSLTANRTDGTSLLALTFKDLSGNEVKLQEYQGKKHVVLVFMRGLTKSPGGICPSCSVQSSRLIAKYDEFENRDAAVLVVYPGSKQSVNEYLLDMKTKSKLADIPLTVLLDEDMTAVNQLGIQKDLAKPSTFIISKTGDLVFGYVGETSVDRPSLSFMLQQLDAIQPKETNTP